jgi:hypothetical protein
MTHDRNGIKIIDSVDICHSSYGSVIGGEIFLALSKNIKQLIKNKIKATN